MINVNETTTLFFFVGELYHSGTISWGQVVVNFVEMYFVILNKK